MKKVKITLLIICFFVATLTQFCGQPNSATDLIDVGKVSMTRRTGNREHCFALNINYVIPATGRPDIAVTPSRLLGYNPALNGFDFSISAARRDLTNTIGINVQINQDNRWTSLQVTYLVSSNPNFIAGSFIGNLVSLSTCVGSALNNRTIVVQTYVPTFRLNQGSNYRVAAFISGFRTLDSTFTLRPVSAKVDPIDGRIAVQIFSNASPSQQYVFVNYFIFPSSTVNNIDFGVSALNQNQQTTYKIEGPIGFLQTGGIQYNQFTICRKEQGCSFNQVFSNGKCECIRGFSKVNDVCRQFCGQNAYINDQNQCICTPGYQFGFNGICQQIGVCRENQTLQPNGQCACRTGFQRSPQGVCIQISCSGSNQVLQPNGACGCDNGYVRGPRNVCVSRCPGDNQIWNGTTCVCAQGYGLSPNRQCVQLKICGANQVLRGNSCQCIQGFTRNPNGVCSACPPGFTLNPNGFCTPTCQQNEQFSIDIGSCQCISGYVKVNNACARRCDANSEWDGRRCVCAAGFAQINGICRRCPPNSRVSSNGQSCSCVGNTIFRQRDLVCASCPINSIAVNNQCTCTQGLRWNSDQTACINAVVCPENGYLGSNGRCLCNQGFRLSNDGRTCDSLCGVNSKFDPQRGCVCNDGFQWNAQISGCAKKPTLTCPTNSVQVQGACICNIGFRFNAQGNCIACPANSSPQSAGVCICNQGFQWSQDGLLCIRSQIVCPANSAANAQNQCVCNPGYQFTPNRQNCLPTVICPTNAFIGPNGACVCNNGLYLQNNQCKVTPVCPANSAWDQSKLTCVCRNQGQYLINGACQACPNNQYWNTTACVCKENLYRIAGVCRSCHISTTYNGTDCVCNLGFYGTRDNCQPCHASCGKCSGPQANQCITCAQITLQLEKGYCTKSTPCSTGFYQGPDGVCQKCTDYCVYCVSELQCGQCASGFQIGLTVFDGSAYAACEPICGDGKKVDIEKCDDGNKKDGDGCSSTCTVENNWYCSGGSSLGPSKCQTPIPASSKIQVKNAVNMLGKVVQGVRVTPIPKCFTDKDCNDCYRILDVKIIDALVPINQVVSYIINSDGQFLIEYNVGGVITNFYFKYQIELNKLLPDEYKNCFTEADYAQQFVGTIDSSTLAKNDKTQTLDIMGLTAQFQPEAIAPVRSGTNSQFGGYSQKIIDLAFGN